MKIWSIGIPTALYAPEKYCRNSESRPTGLPPLMAHDRELLLLLAFAVLARPADAQLNTCEDAVAAYREGEQACPGPWSPSTCGNLVCEAMISSLDDEALSSIKAGFTACGDLPNDSPNKNYVSMKDQFNYMMILQLTIECGLNASAVKLTPPALDTCDGASTRLMVFSM